MSNIDALIVEVEGYERDIAELQRTIADQVHALNQKKIEAEEKLDKEIYATASAEFSDKDYGCGTVNFETANYKIKTVVSKKVKWDENELRKIEKQIREAGQDPEHYIKYKLSVSETDFKKFPEAIQAAFVPARTVEPSAPVISWEAK